MLGGIIKKLLGGDEGGANMKEINPYVEQAKSEFDKLQGISNDELRAKSDLFRKRLKDHVSEEEKTLQELGQKAEDSATPISEKEQLYAEIDKLKKQIDTKLEEVLDEILPEGFAVIKETARRFAENKTLEVTATELDTKLAESKGHITISGDKAIWQNTWDAAGTEIEWNMVHYDVQLIGGTALHKGKVAEMQTGEGKTLVATLPVYLNGLTGKGVHVVTVNNYLAKRDSEWMGPIYEFHGLTVDCIDKHTPNSPERKAAYQCDITFGTNNEFGFDYLRDNMVNDPENLVQKKHHYAIIDEVDSVLIDDARTPLIISGPTPQGDQHEFQELKPKVQKLVESQRKLAHSYLTEAKKKLVALTNEEGEKKEIKKQIEEGGVALLKAFRALPKNKALIKYLSEPGIRAHLQKTENYYLQDQGKEMKKIDADLFFTIDEKNNSIEILDKGIDLISGEEDPTFYIMPDIGTLVADIENSGKSESEQLKMKDSMLRDYQVKGERIHTMNQLMKAYTLFEKEVEYVVMDNKVKIVDEQTGRIMDGRRYSDGLHQAIEAKENVKVEAATQTYATITLQNYFRMYHKLAGMTGTAETEAKELWDIYELDVMAIPTNKPVQRDDREDLVFKTAREKYNAIIEEIERMVEAGRPVLVGTTTVEISELLSKLLSMKKIKHNVLNAKLHQKEAEIVAEAGLPGNVTIATNMAGRGTDIKLGPGVKDAGGLAIIGTERHDSRRVDRQLRGRAGRQGDPGSSQFFVSLEDNLMRLFGSERIAKMMDRLGLKEGEVIQHKMITKSIERAQKKVEENNFGIRKNLLEYDDVMNSQRNAIYRKRKNALFGDRLDLDIDTTFQEIAASIVEYNVQNGDFENFKLESIMYLAVESPISEEEFFKADEAALTKKMYELTREAYTRKNTAIVEQAFPVVSQVYENQRDQYENMVIPFFDGRRKINLVVNLIDSFEKKGTNITKELEKIVTLAIIDQEWKEHLREMDDLRTSVRNAQYEQKDPLLIYKLESFELFRGMMDQLNKDTLSFLMRAHLPSPEEERQAAKRQMPKQTDVSKLQAGRTDLTQASQQNQQVASRQQNGQPIKRKPEVREVRKIGRNDRVKVLNVRSGETKEMKFKQAEHLIANGLWQLVDES
ncbi:MAG: preprotein translocase subunit SecA [Crocinitomicaceae bacterium]|nr:preprotein translocase subunit SecA [Crocinitomicaceae bacterium]